MSLVSMIIADRMESLTKYYDRWMNLITGGQDKRVREAVLGYIEPGDLVLDVGCGTGTLAIKAAQKGAQVIGIDQSPAMLKLAQKLSSSCGILTVWLINTIWRFISFERMQMSLRRRTCTGSSRNG